MNVHAAVDSNAMAVGTVVVASFATFRDSNTFLVFLLGERERGPVATRGRPPRREVGETGQEPARTEPLEAAQESDITGLHTYHDTP